MISNHLNSIAIVYKPRALEKYSVVCDSLQVHTRILSDFWRNQHENLFDHFCAWVLLTCFPSNFSQFFVFSNLFIIESAGYFWLFWESLHMARVWVYSDWVYLHGICLNFFFGSICMVYRSTALMQKCWSTAWINLTNHTLNWINIVRIHQISFNLPSIF